MYLFSIAVIDVDSKGNVWRLKKKSNGKYGGYYHIKPYILGYKNSDGYIFNTLSCSGNQYGVFCHSLVWIFNNGLIPNGMEINHKNGIKDDNRLENLEVVTPRQNICHARDVLGIQFGGLGVNNGLAILTEKEVIEIRDLYNVGNITHKKLSKMFNCCEPNIQAILARKSWKLV